MLCIEEFDCQLQKFNQTTEAHSVFCKDTHGGGLYINNHQYTRGGSGKKEGYCANKDGVFWMCVWCIGYWIKYNHCNVQRYLR